MMFVGEFSLQNTTKNTGNITEFFEKNQQIQSFWPAKIWKFVVSKHIASVFQKISNEHMMAKNTVSIGSMLVKIVN